MTSSADFTICVTCGTQFDTTKLDNCRICDDPRQFVPPTGQAWTTLAKLRKGGFKNVWTRDAVDERVWFITSEPKIGIGQRAIFCQTQNGNFLWDCVPYIDAEFVQEVISKGGIQAMAISHPHYYTTHIEWAKAFHCPVYLACEDKEWLNREDDSEQPYRNFIDTPAKEIFSGVTAIKTGGHFPGSLVLHWDNKLLHADSIQTIPSGIYHIDRPEGTTSYSFMWSYPNMIPLDPDSIYGIWKAIEPFEFETTHGGFPGFDIRGTGKKRILESMKIWIKKAGQEKAAILEETCD